MYKCATCGETKPESEMCADRRACRACKRAYSKAYYHGHPEYRKREIERSRQAQAALSAEVKRNRVAASRKRTREEKKVDDPLNLKFTDLIKRSRERARNKKMKFDLTIDYLKELYTLQGGLCKYTGFQMSIDFNIEGGLPTSISIDRIKSSKGYVRGNVVLCCFQANVMKHSLTHEELKKWCRAILYESNWTRSELEKEFSAAIS